MTFTDDDLNPQSFSDAELKRMKADEWVPACRVRALLSRLEAAEKVAEYADEWAPKGIPALSMYLANWRKARGE